MLVRLGDVTVAVCSPVALVRETVAEFYPTAALGVPQWTVTALGRQPVPLPATLAAIHAGQDQMP